MSNKKFLIIFIGAAILSFAPGISVSAYEAEEYIPKEFIEESKDVTQGGLAVILTRCMGLESELPKAPIQDDYIKTLDKNGIRPLGGWDQKKLLTNGDFAVILVHALGLDNKLVSAEEAYDRGREYIEKMWKIQYEQDGYRKSLENLLEDKRFFPKGPPESPFGYKYVDKDGDYAIDPIAILPGKRELQPTVRYIYTLEKKGVILKGPPEAVLTAKSVKAALNSPVFRGAPGYVNEFGLLKEEVKEKAEQAVTPITPGGP